MGELGTVFANFYMDINNSRDKTVLSLLYTIYTVCLKSAITMLTTSWTKAGTVKVVKYAGPLLLENERVTKS